MFGNCKLLKNLSILSKWNLKDDFQIKTMFIGCETYERQLESRENFNFCDYIHCILINCCKCCSKCCKYCCKLFWYIIFLICLLSITILILKSPFVPLYSSFNLGKLDQEISEMKQDIDLINDTNVTHISSILNITNSSLIKKMSENKEGVICYFLDYIRKKSNKSLKKNKNTFKVYSIIIAITNTINIIFFVLCVLALKYITISIMEYKNKLLIILSAIFILNIVSIIFEILELLIDLELYDSINKIKIELEYFFQTEFEEDYFSDIEYLSDTIVAICVDLFITIISIIIIIFLFNDLLDPRRRPRICN